MSQGLSGMTGFGRAAGAAEWGRWTWEAKSVNGRSLDTRLAIPSGLEALEPRIKTSAKKRFGRGALQIALRVDIEAVESDVGQVNLGLLDALCSVWEERTGQRIDPAALATLMTSRGVVEPSAGASLRDLSERSDVLNALMQDCDAALDGLEHSRREEGRALSELLEGLLDQMEDLRLAAEAQSAQQPALVKARLEQRLAELAVDAAVDADRLAAETALQAAKADVREELDRLSAHIGTGRSLLAAQEPVGRKLDFLAQELNREANTLCSKSVNVDLTNTGLGLKALIDQFKEQAANVE
ncbi:MAG: YicC/YloC family endoribonuclease [Pseudomonadota bacterium]